MMKDTCGIDYAPLVLGKLQWHHSVALSGYANDYRTFGACVKYDNRRYQNAKKQFAITLSINHCPISWIPLSARDLKSFEAQRHETMIQSSYKCMNQFNFCNTHEFNIEIQSSPKDRKLLSLSAANRGIYNRQSGTKGSKLSNSGTVLGLSSEIQLSPKDKKSLALRVAKGNKNILQLSAKGAKSLALGMAQGLLK